MSKARRLIAVLSVAGACAIALTAGSGSASAELRQLTVTLIGGTQITVTVDVPPGTPVSAITIPGIPPNQIVSVTEGPPPPGGPTSTGVSVGTTSTSSSTPAPPPPSGSSSSGSQSQTSSGSQGGRGPSSSKPSAGPTVGAQRKQKATGKALLPPVAGATQPGAAKTKARPQVPPPLSGQVLPNGLPTALNPSLTVAVPGAALPGVPDFFIDKFRIPPVLIRIYEAAGTQYDVPWQVLAAINEIESDYGRDLSTSTAGAIGWMQFLPSTWREWGVDVTGTGVKDPYDPADAIFAAARYLSAAGAAHNLRGAIYAYNHADWYVQSVLLRAKLIGGLPSALLGAVAGLAYGHFPVHARSRYADDLSAQSATARYARSHNLPMPATSVGHVTGVNIYARAGAPVIAVQDGQIVDMGHSPKLGNYIRLQDAYGNIYTYSGVKRLVTQYPVPKPKSESKAQIAKDLARKPAAPDKAPTAPATAGYQLPQTPTAPVSPAAPAPSPAPAGPASPATAPIDLSQVASQVLDGAQLFAGPAPVFKPSAPFGLPAGKDFSSYFTDVVGLSRNDVVMHPMKVGSKVIAGTILGRIGNTGDGLAPHVLFQVRPAGKHSPLIDPKPILDGWVLLERSSLYRARGLNPFVNTSPTVGQVLLESKEQLQVQVLRDPDLTIYSCGRRDIAAGQVDQRVLTTMEFLSASGFRLNVSALRCGHTGPAKPGDLAFGSGNAFSIAGVDGIPVVGHQGAGSVSDLAIRRTLTLQGTMKPAEIISARSYPNTDNTVADSKRHLDHIDVGFLPLYSSDPALRKQVDSTLAPSQWIKLIGRLGQIAAPQVPAGPSSAAIPDQPAPAQPRHK